LCVEANDTCLPSYTYYYDADAKLLWDSPSAEITWSQASETCEKADACDSKDWQAPTVDQLRTVILGCSATQTGGACRLAENCLESTCGESCTGCAERETDAQYLPKQLSNAQRYVWTRSRPPDEPDRAWVFDARTASFTTRLTLEKVAGKICVRAD
jgi:hypothetical protein